MIFSKKMFADQKVKELQNIIDEIKKIKEEFSTSGNKKAILGLLLFDIRQYLLENIFSEKAKLNKNSDIKNKLVQLMQNFFDLDIGDSFYDDRMVFAGVFYYYVYLPGSNIECQSLMQAILQDHNIDSERFKTELRFNKYPDFDEWYLSFVRPNIRKAIWQ